MMAKLDKKLEITLPILIVIVIAVVITTVMINNSQPSVDPNLNIVESDSAEDSEIIEENNMLFVSFNGEKREVALENNATAKSLLKMLPMELTMSDLNGNEKYAYLDEPLLTEEYSPQQIEAGDVMLFGDNCLVIFYESFETEYKYTKIGHIDELPEMGGGNVVVRLEAE
jgi:hypothetical protein